MSCFIDYSKLPNIDNYEDWCSLNTLFKIAILKKMGVDKDIFYVLQTPKLVKKLFDNMNNKEELNNG